MAGWQRAFSIVVLSFLMAAGALTSVAWADTRVALVIGNSDYRNVGRLANPANDAVLVSSALKRAGFTTVELKHNLDVVGMRAALHEFARMAEGADIALVYYAGHGIEVANTNYLVPVDAQLSRDTDVEFEAIQLDLVLHSVSTARRLRIVVLDACRNNPFGTQVTGVESRAVNRGLARVELSGTNTLVAYAAKDGTTAADGAGENSPFASAFARDIAVPGLEVRRMFGKVRDDVMAATQNGQEPYLYGSMGGEEVYFVKASSKEPIASLSPAAPKTDPAAIELALWNAVAESKDVAQLQSYLDKYPGGVFAGAARAKLKALHPAASPTQDNRAVELELWNAVSASNDPAQLQSYLNQFPQGVFAATAQAKIAALQRRAQPAPRPALAAPSPAAAIRVTGLNTEVQRVTDQAFAEEAKARGKAEDAKRAQKLAQDAAKEATPVPIFVTSNGTYHLDNGLAGWEFWGQFNCANAMACGFGVKVWRSTGDRYEGEWSDNLMIGVGVYTYGNGSRYEGQWDDSHYGDATKVLGVDYGASDSPVREAIGQFKDNNLDGVGVVYNRDGTVVVGHWKSGKLDGLGAKLDANGGVAEQGRYKNGALVAAMVSS